ncbi:MAG: site-specific DNA-methyltransferase [Oscillibacter sp.]|nr:site-specific DNA-methyltransferase [Oscillibacter sp.]
MIKDIMAKNDTVAPNEKEMAALREHFPACFTTDGGFDIERFKEYLSDKVAVTNEGYELRFLGKNYARLLASLDTTTVIVPDEEHNSKPENANSQNLYISGDNLDGLKHLLKSYTQKVKCIYIDPPYNTGSDGFVYNDTFNFTAEELADKLSISDEQASRILDLTKRGSASHSAWLMFMYPRLLLARDLLKDDGVIFISIDDNEHSDLKLLCDDVFGEDHFIADFPRVTKRGGKSSDIVALNHDYLLMYSKTSNPSLYAIEHNDKDFKYDDEFLEDRGYYKLNQTLDYDSLQYSASLDYPIELDGEVFYPGQSEELYLERQAGNHDVADWAWRWSKEKFEFGLANGFIVVKNGRTGKRIYTKTYQKASIEDGDEGYYIDYSDRTKSLSTLETTENTYSNDNATKDIAKTVGKKVFDHTKPLELIALIARLCTRKDDIILDFFSGSATTAEGVMRINCIEPEDERKYIMIQLQEQCKEGTSAYKAGYRTICDIGMDRIAKAASNYKKEFPSTTIDFGFRHFTLVEPSTETLDKLEAFNPESNTMYLENTVLDDFGVPTVLATWLVRDGYGFTAPVQTLDFAGYTGYYIDKHLYLINPDLSETAITAITDKYETDGSFNPENVVLCGYSFLWTEIESLKTNLARLKDTEKNLRINFDIRY